jgi:hypothetical protein
VLPFTCNVLALVCDGQNILIFLQLNVICLLVHGKSLFQLFSLSNVYLFPTTNLFKMFTIHNDVLPITHIVLVCDDNYHFWVMVSTSLHFILPGHWFVPHSFINLFTCAPHLMQCTGQQITLILVRKGVMYR